MPIPGLPFTDDEIYQTVHGVMPAWILIATVPGSKVTQAVVLLTTLYFCALYAVLIFTEMANSSESGSFSTLDGVKKLLATPGVVLPAWVHYIAFDLWTGRWISLDASARRIPRLIIAPILFFTLMLGPVGLLGYFLIRGFWRYKSKAE